MENMFTVVASTLDKVEARVNEINQASAMISTIKSDNAFLIRNRRESCYLKRVY